MHAYVLYREPSGHIVHVDLHGTSRRAIFRDAEESRGFGMHIVGLVFTEDDRHLGELKLPAVS